MIGWVLNLFQSYRKQQWEYKIKIKKYQLIILKDIRDSETRSAEIAIDRFYQKEGKNDRLQACLYTQNKIKKTSSLLTAF